MVADSALLNLRVWFACRVRGYPQRLTDGVNRETASKCTCTGHPFEFSGDVFRRCKVLTEISVWSRYRYGQLHFSRWPDDVRHHGWGIKCLEKRSLGYPVCIHTLLKKVSDVKSWRSVDALSPDSKTSGQNRVYTSSRYDLIVLVTLQCRCRFYAVRAARMFTSQRTDCEQKNGLQHFSFMSKVVRVCFLRRCKLENHLRL